MNKRLLTTIGFLCLLFNGYSQNVFDPNDAVTNYNNSNPPRKPGPDTIAKWYRTPHSRVTWDTRRFKPYVLNDMAFRLRYPNGYNANDNTKKYPIIIFFHGGGEIGGLNDNEFQLLWGAQMFEQMINDGKFNAYLFFPQQNRIGWEETYFNRINMVIDSLVKYGNVDIDRIIPMGLSIGGNGVLYYSMLYPQRAALAIPSSPSWIESFVAHRDKFKHIPVWVGSGGVDPNPHQGNVKRFVDSMNAIGADVRWSLFPSLGHVCWNEQWSQSYLAPYWNAAHKANPVVLFRKTQFCPDTPVNATIGITAGFYAYQWQRDGATIAESEGAAQTIFDDAALASFTRNEITVILPGTYKVRFKRSGTSEWSAWSPNPAVIYHKPYTITPPIQVTGLKSKVMPSPDGNTTIPLELPSGYSGYLWKDASTNAVVGTSRTLHAGPGTYIAIASQSGTCGSQASPVFVVTDANGDPKPEVVTDLTATRLSATSIQLSWTQDPTPESEETAFEIYRSTGSGGPYTLVGVVPANASTFINFGLPASSNFFYAVRSVNESGASQLSGEATLFVDVVPPDAPGNLQVVSVTTNAATLNWDNSSDNVAVTGYDIYVNGVKRISAVSSEAEVIGLQPNTTYTFSVKAIDAEGNQSAFSNEAEGKTNEVPDVLAPAAPTNLAVLSVTINSVSLDWDDATDNVGVTGYEIYVEGVKITSSASSDVVVNGLVPNTSYVFSVKAADLAGNTSGFSNEITGKTGKIPDVTPPTVPANLSALSVTSNSVSLYWHNSTDDEGVSAYDIYVDGVKKQSSVTSNAVVEGLAANTTYLFTVNAVDLSGNVSGFSNALTAITSQAPDVTAPSVPANLKVVSVTSSSISLDWDNSTDNVGVVTYDVYVNGVKKYNGPTSELSATGLSPNTTYTFNVRARDAANNVSAASASVSGKTSVLADVTKPTAPKNLKVVYTSRTTIELDWDAATDNVGLVRYDVYINGLKKYSTTNTAIVANNLVSFKTYIVAIIAVDQAGNMSPASNVVAGRTELQGLKYSYYEGAWSMLPNFSNLNVVKQGITPDVNLDEKRSGVNENYGFVWQGYIKIEKSGTYTFETISDDGSKFYFNTLYSSTATPFVNNDGEHAERSVSRSIYVKEGVYPIAVTFFERSGDAKMRLLWKGPGIKRQEIPASAFTDNADVMNQRNNKNSEKEKWADGDDNNDDGDDQGNLWGFFFNENAGANQLTEQPATSPLSGQPEITRAYPSPFIDKVNVEFYNKASDSKVEVNVYDMHGRLVHVQKFNGLPAGRRTLNINMSNKQLHAGVYMIRMVVNGQASKLMKLVRSSR